MNHASKILKLAVSRLSSTSLSPRLDAELLLAHVTGLSKLELISRSQENLDSDAIEQFEKLIERRTKSEPIAYIIGSKEFWGLKLTVTPDVLVPRPETELLVEKGLEFCSTISDPLRVLDLGTGSGAIAIALAQELSKFNRDFDICCVDQSKAALDVAKLNFERFGLISTVKFIRSNWFDGVGDTRYDLIVSNPPYVPVGATNLSPELSYEPHEALFAGDDGLASIRKIVDKLPAHLSNRGAFLCEMGFNQKTAIESLSTKYASRKLAFFKDLAGNDRVFQLL